MRFPWLIFPLLLACSGGDEGGFNKEGFSKPPEPATVVEVAPVERGTVTEILVTSATVEASASADLMPQATGQVRRVLKDIGDTVRAGELLAVIHNVGLSAGADLAQSEVAHNREIYQETLTLFERGAVSQKDLDVAKYNLDQAVARSREASYNRDNSRITAPFSGIIAARDIRVGEIATASERAFQVVDLSELRVRAYLPERELPKVQVGQVATLRASYDDTQTATAKVMRVAPVVDSNTGTFEVVMVLDADQTVLKPGQFVKISLEVAEHKDVVVMPRNALIYEEGAPVAYVMVETEETVQPQEVEESKTARRGGGRRGPGFGGGFRSGSRNVGDPFASVDSGPKYVAERRALDVGLIDTTTVEIEGGLEEGEQLITVGQSNLRDGSRVRTTQMVRDLEEKLKAKTETKNEDEPEKEEG